MQSMRGEIYSLETRARRNVEDELSEYERGTFIAAAMDLRYILSKSERPVTNLVDENTTDWGTIEYLSPIGKFRIKLTLVKA